MHAPPIRLFVYGTLKEGFPNHGINTGRRVPGRFRTWLAYPLLVVRLPQEDRAPWLLDQAGQGLPVWGEVYEVDAATLAAMDVLEEVGRPTGYVRRTIDLQDADHPDQPCEAVAYLKPADHLPQCLATEGPFAEYTPALARGYWLRQG